MPQATQTMTSPNAPTVPDAQRFLDANRIHVAGGSMFLDPYLVVHPREMAPGKEKELRAKLELTYGLNNPSFYESSDRLPIALNLASLIPVSLESKRSNLMREIETFNNETRTRVDSSLAQSAADRVNPFAAIVRDTIHEPGADPVGMEVLKNGLTFYMLLRESLTRHGYLNRLNDYVRFNDTPDQILTCLQDEVGVSAETLTEVARTQGLSGVSRVLGLEDAYLKETQQFVERVSKKEFSYNDVEHWHIGRQLLKDKPAATIDDKIAVGFERRIHDTMAQLKAKAKGMTDVPSGVKAKENWVAEGLGLVPAIQRQLMWDLGYEIGYTDEPVADKIAFHSGVYGLHRTTKDNNNDVRGTYRIYFGSKGDPEGAHRTLVHEITHNLWPSMFAPQEVTAIDQLANADRARIKVVARMLREDFPTFKNLMNAYHAANASPEQKAGILQQANARYAKTLGPLDALFKENSNPYEVLDMADHADQRLHIDGLLYKQSGYHGPQERFREVISRYAELRYVRLRTEPALMNFIAPGLAQVYDNYYLPHLERLHTKIVAGQGAQEPRMQVAANENTEQRKPQPEEILPAADQPRPVAQPLPDAVLAEGEGKKPIPQPETTSEPKRIDQPAGHTHEPQGTQKSDLPETPVSVEPPKVETPVIEEPKIEAANNNHPPAANTNVAQGGARTAASHSDRKPHSTIYTNGATVAALKTLDSMGVDLPIGLTR